jgi:hypothetical protein
MVTLMKVCGTGAGGGIVLAIVVAFGHWLLTYARSRKTKIAVESSSALARIED